MAALPCFCEFRASAESVVIGYGWRRREQAPLSGRRLRPYIQYTESTGVLSLSEPNLNIKTTLSARLCTRYVPLPHVTVILPESPTAVRLK